MWELGKARVLDWLCCGLTWDDFPWRNVEKHGLVRESAKGSMAGMPTIGEGMKKLQWDKIASEWGAGTTVSVCRSSLYIELGLQRRVERLVISFGWARKLKSWQNGGFVGDPFCGVVWTLGTISIYTLGTQSFGGYDEWVVGYWRSFSVSIMTTGGLRGAEGTEEGWSIAWDYLLAY